MPVEMIDMMRGYEFWREGCERMRASVCELLRLAGKSVTLANVLRVVESLPKNRSHAVPEEWREKSYCCNCLELAHAKAVNEIDAARFDFLFAYFVDYFPQRTTLAQETMIDAFVGILRGLELDPRNSSSE